MKRTLLFFLLFVSVCASAQTTYYWVGGKDPAPASISAAANWNTSVDGNGSPRASNIPSTGGTDILIFDGTNYGGTTLATGLDSVNVGGSISCSQMKFINSANIVFVRTTTAGGGTSTVTIAGASGDDFFIETGSKLLFTNAASSGGSIRFAMAATTTGRVSGNLSFITGFQARFDNTISGNAGAFVFTSGSTFTTNITSTASYAFGNSTQSTEKWVVFEPGSTMFYDGGNSPMASSSTFQPVEFIAGSDFIMRASNPTSGAGTFFNRKAYANIIVQNGVTLTADGTVNRIDTLTVNTGGTFITHTSGQTSVLGDLIVHGNIGAPATSTNELMLAGNLPQKINGIGVISVPSFVVTDGANIILEKNIAVNRSATINGRIDFGTFQLSGPATFTARSAAAAVTATGNRTAGSYILAGVTGVSGLNRGLTISGTGLQPGTRVISYTTNFDSIYISRPALTSGTGTSFTIIANPATLVTSNSAAFDPVNGSVALTDTKTYSNGINYIINAATVSPFGVTTGSDSRSIDVGDVFFNAAVTTNASPRISGTLQATGKVTIRPLDTVWLRNGANLSGFYNNAVYFITDVNAAGETGVFRRDNVTGNTVFPIGTATHYLPATLNPVSSSDLALNVFQGITSNGLPIGTPLTPLQKQTVVDAVWNVNRVNGTGDANLQLQWTPALEGTTLATFADTAIGIIKNNGTSWSLPFGIGDNTANTADTTFNTFGQFSVGARPPKDPFLFNELPPKTYGDADFSPGVISSNTTQPISYISSNTAVATIINGNIHITGTGTTTITATQASDGFYPTANVSQPLTVNKASLTIKADRKIKPEGDPNPPLTATYTGFVRGETPAVLLTPVVLTTTATTTSPPGNYLITAAGATAANYTITFVNDSLIVRPRTAQTISFPALTTRTYGAADFSIGATSSNNTIPITYTSSNTSVATIVGNSIRIVGAGTTTITASQAGNDLFFPAANVSQTLTVNRAPLTIRVADTTKAFGQPNPTFRVVYTGFVKGEDVTVFSSPLVINTTAGNNSAPGYYTLEPAGVVAANYNITYVPGRLTILPATGTGIATLQAFAVNSNSLTVRIYSPEPDLGDVFFYDINGRLLARKNVFMPQGFISTSLDIAGLAPGTYVVHVVSAKTKLKLMVAIFR